jgi:hypothetical protein
MHILNNLSDSVISFLTYFGTSRTEWGHRTFLYKNYTGRKISTSLSYITVRGEGKIERATEEQDALCAVASLPVPWLAGHQHICIGQQSLEISYKKYIMVSYEAEPIIQECHWTELTSLDYWLVGFCFRFLCWFDLWTTCKELMYLMNCDHLFSLIVIRSIYQGRIVSLNDISLCINFTIQYKL